MYEEALRDIARQADHVVGDLAREALARAAEVGQRAVVDFEASREQMIKLRRDTIEECAQTVEIIRQGANVLPRYLVVQRIRDMKGGK